MEDNKDDVNIFFTWFCWNNIMPIFKENNKVVDCDENEIAQLQRLR